MRKKYRHSQEQKLFIKILWTAVSTVLICLAVKAGIAWAFLFSNGDASIIKNADVSNFKITLNNSLPLIDMVYNSGKVNASVSEEIQKLVETVFNFDISNPLTLLNSQSSMLNSYYNKIYLRQPSEKINENLVYDTGENDESSKEQADNSQGNKQDENSTSSEDNEEKTESPQGGVVSNGEVLVENETKYKINSGTISSMLNEPLKFRFDKKGPKVLIYHTHTTESYLKDIADLNKPGVANRTNDSRYNVIRVGEEIAQNLRKRFGIEVIHNGIIHDYPSTNGAYERSFETANKILKSYPSIRVIIDVHRDGIDGKKLRAVTKVNGKNAAQIMFVVGSAQKLAHPNWRENLKLAVKLEGKLNGKYPGLAKPIYISENRYNQQLVPGALLIEVGGDGNTVGECLESAKYIAEALNDVIK